MLANDITFSLKNPVVTGTGTRYFEFDIFASTSGSSIYYDGALFRLSYNTSAFGSEIVKNNKITITRGPSFNSNTYTDPNADRIDQTTSVIGVPLNSRFGESSWTRTLLSNSPVLLLHFKIEIQTCGQNVDIDFADQDFTNGFSTYCSTPGAAQTDALFFSTTNYQNPLSNILCEVKLDNFNSSVNAGINEILEISGSDFGSTRGKGQVKFKSADDGGKTYIQKLDNFDYALWSDKVIKIRVPSIIEDKWIPGSGDFIVVNDAGDSISSSSGGKPFIIYYSHGTLEFDGKKFHSNLQNKNNLGAYTIRLDKSVTSDPRRVACIKKAIKNWKCATAINFILGSDTTLSGPKSDNITTIAFADAIAANTSILAITSPIITYCPGKKDTTAVVKEFDIMVKNSINLSYDTTGAIIPSGQNSFLEIITHELGHALGLMHVNDDTQVMFWSTQPSGKSPRTLKPYTSDVEGGIDEVSRSISSLSSGNECGFKAVQPSNTFGCNIVTLIELLEYNSNITIIAYPNPVVDGELNISFQSSKSVNSQVIIRDIVGKEVSMTNVTGIDNFTQTINVSNLSAGMYFVNLVVDNKKISTKFVKN